MYSYTPAGLATVKRLHIYLPFYDTLYGGFRDAWSDTQASFSYTGWGALSGMTLPAEATNNGSTTWHTVPVTFYTGYDSAGRPDSMTDNDQNAINGSGRTWVENVAYDYAGRMTSSDTWTGIYDNRYYYYDPVNGWTCCNDYYTDVYNRETRAYNVNGQMTSQLWSSNGGGTSFPTATGNQYIYSPPGTPTPNNGQVMQEVKGSETVTYQYDALKRLISSSATPVTGSTPAAWTQTFQYDGFGNLTGKVLSGTATAIPVDNTTNRLTNATYDNNGNMLTGSVNGSGVTLGYDGANRMISATKYSGGTELYGYAPDNKRIVTVPADGSSPVWTLWGPQGQKLGDFNIVGNFVGSGVQTWSNFTGYVSVVGPTLYFAGRKIWEQGADGEWHTTAVNNGGSVVTDRLGSAGVYLPYGDTNGSAAGGRSFATYARGSLTGLDYADQRFYASSYGRFNTVDPMNNSAGLNEPGSWNRYSYVAGDPINRSDPRGLCSQDSSGNLYDDDNVPGTTLLYDGQCGRDGSGAVTAIGAGGAVTVTASPDPVPCVSASGASVACGDDSSYGGVAVNQEFVAAMEQYLAPFDIGLVGTARIGVPDTPVQSGGTVKLSPFTGISTSPTTVVRMPVPIPGLTKSASIGGSVTGGSYTIDLPVGTAVTYQSCGQTSVTAGLNLPVNGYLNISVGYYVNISCPGPTGTPVSGAP
jgi:RHS repeat-associated protein